MKRNGFTLVELLGVIVLLGILGVVIVPQIGESITNSKNNAYITQLESIKKGVNDFLIDNSYILLEDGVYTIKLDTLKKGGYLPIDIKNPKSKKSFSNESIITIIVTNGKYEINLDLRDIVDVTENIDGKSPIIVLNGNFIEYVEVNSIYNELGATAKSIEGDNLTVDSPQIKLGDDTKESIDTSQLNTYSLVYSATDSEGISTSVTRTVIVRDTTPPVIKVPSDTTIFINQISSFNVMNGVVVSDNYDSDVTVTTNSNLADMVGNYVITYTAVDSSGNESSVRRVINVSDVTNNFAYKINGNTVASSDEDPTMENPVTYTGLGSTGYIDIVSTGKNLFDKSKYLKMEDYKFNEYSYYLYKEIYLKPNTTYKVSVKRYNGYDGTTDGYLLINNVFGINSHGWSSIAHTTSPDYSESNYIYTTKLDGLLYIGVARNVVEQENLDNIWANTDVQIEEGNVATEFEAYKGGTTRIDMTGHDPLMCASDICDYIDYNSKKIVRYVKKIVFDDSLRLYFNEWSGQNTTNTRGIYYNHNSILGSYGYPTFIDRTGFSTHFISGDSGFTADDTLRFSVRAFSSPPYISFRIPLDLDWANWLTEQKNAGTPLTVYIVLKEPEYEDINLPSFDFYDNYQYYVTDGNISSTMEIIR